MAHGGLLPAEVAAICGACVRLALELPGLGTGMRMGLGEGDDAGVCRGLGKEGACRRFAAGSVGGDGDLRPTCLTVGLIRGSRRKWYGCGRDEIVMTNLRIGEL